MTENWEALLEDELDLEIDFNGSSVRIEAPGGFGRSEYRQMLEETWPTEDIGRMTHTGRAVELAAHGANLSVESVKEIYDEISSEDTDPDNITHSLAGAFFGYVTVVGAPAFSVMEWSGSGIESFLEKGAYSESDTLYDISGDKLSVAKLIYAEGEGVTVSTPLFSGEGSPDRDVVERTARYMDDFRA